jgi:hypothetical protein
MKQSLKLKAMKIIYKLLILFVVIPSISLMAQKPEKDILVIGVKYYNTNNYTHHLVFKTRSKINGKFKNIPEIKLFVYINNDSEKANCLGQVTTNDVGDAVFLIPPAAKTAWVSAPNQTFIAVSETNKQFDKATGEVAITKAKLKIDTANGRIVNASIVALVDSIWTPIPETEIQLGIKRLDGNLGINETLAYTSDSLGAVTAEFKRDSLPGDLKGNLVLVASVVDNETYGNLTAEIIVPWGKYYAHPSKFNERTLFARRGLTPLWLELLAYAIVVAVWTVIIYLVLQIKKLKRLGV